MRNIRRYEHNGATSWVVAFKRAGKRYVQYFADGDEGKAVSRRRAQTWRDQMERKLVAWNKLHRRSSLNTSGHIGVSIIVDRTRAGTPVQRCVAHWPTADGGRRKKSFSVLVYGKTGALRRAIAARRQGVAEMLAARAVR
jgi:hypothetical protein